MFECRYGLDTSNSVELASLDSAADEHKNYIPSSWGTMRRIAQLRPIGTDDVFVDFGSGKGRMVFLAAQHPFKRVVGVEISRVLHEIAEANVSRNRPRLRCKDIQLVCEDVLRFSVPDDMTFGYFFNPFTGETFKRVVEKIRASWQAHPRQITIVYTNPIMHEHLARQHWLRVLEHDPTCVGIYETVGLQESSVTHPPRRILRGADSPTRELGS